MTTKGIKTNNLAFTMQHKSPRKYKRKKSEKWIRQSNDSKAMLARQLASLFQCQKFYRRENKVMNEVKDITAIRANYYALLIAILTKATAKDSLMTMNICSDVERGEKNV